MVELEMIEMGQNKTLDLESGSYKHASVGRRFVAYFIDEFVNTPPLIVVIFAIVLSTDSIMHLSAEPAIGIGIFLLVLFGGITAVKGAYWTFFEGRYGTTPGKAALGIAVVGRDGKKPGYAKAAIRNISKYLMPLTIMNFSLAIDSFGFLIEPHRQRLLDRAVGTFVIRRTGLLSLRKAVVMVILIWVVSLGATVAFLPDIFTEKKVFNNGEISFRYTLPLGWYDAEYADLLDEYELMEIKETIGDEAIFWMASESEGIIEGIIYLTEAGSPMGLSLEDVGLGQAGIAQVEGLQISNLGLINRNENQWYTFDTKSADSEVVGRLGVTYCNDSILLLIGGGSSGEFLGHYDRILDTFECKQQVGQ